MKTIFFILMLMPLNSFSIDTSVIIENSRSIDTLLEKNEKLERRVNSMYQKIRDKVLEEQLATANQVIADQNSLFDGFGVMYGVITIVIGILTITLPIFTYLFGIKPSQDAIKELNYNFDKKLEHHLKEQRKVQVDEAIQTISMGNVEFYVNSINYLILTQHQGFSNEQLFKMSEILKMNGISNEVRGQIGYILATQKAIYAKPYFMESIHSQDVNSGAFINAIIYMTGTGIKNYLKEISDSILSSKEPKKRFYDILNKILYSTSFKEECLVLINDIELLDKMNISKDAPSRMGIKRETDILRLFDLSIMDKEFEEKYKNSILYKRLKD